MATYSARAHARHGGQERAGGSEGCFALIYGEPEKPTVRASKILLIATKSLGFLASLVTWLMQRGVQGS